jgi:calcium-dependent protein kinase
MSLSIASTASGFCSHSAASFSSGAGGPPGSSVSAASAAGWSVGRGAAEDEDEDDDECSTCGTSNSGCAWILSTFGGREVLAEYEFGLPLGRGTFGVTRLVTERVSARVFACKTVCKERINSRQYVEDMRSEVSILQHLVGVPGVVQLRGAYEDCRAVNLVLELCAGGDLLDHILRLGRLPEDDAAAAARAIVLALQRCHARGVMHRDVKPENFLLAADGCAASCRVSDFGVSAFFEPGQKFREVVGTPYYMAPEVLLRCYDQVGGGRLGGGARPAELTGCGRSGLVCRARPCLSTAKSQPAPAGAWHAPIRQRPGPSHSILIVNRLPASPPPAVC